MSVYVDAMFSTEGYHSKTWLYKEACHLLADTEEELVEFAIGIGLKPEWLQHGHCIHFDLTKNKRMQAVKAGAIEVTSGELVAWMRKKREEQKKDKTK